MNIIQKAHIFAKRKHADKKRKFSGELYYSHPVSVAERLMGFDELKDDMEVIASAYLHDILEDTESTYEEIVREFNRDIADIVAELTSDEDLYKGDPEHKARKKGDYLARKISQMSDKARLVKLADRENNVSDLDVCGSEFAERYARETKIILDQIQAKNEIEKTLIDSIWDYIEPFLE